MYFWTSLLLFLPTFTMGSDLSTTLEKVVPASQYDIEQAMMILEKAIVAQEKERFELLETARRMIENKKSKVFFESAFFVEDLKLWSIDLNSNERYLGEYWPTDMCYIGETVQALELANFSLKNGYWEFSDEYSLTALRLEAGKLLVDLNDLPNEISNTYEIPHCQNKSPRYKERLLEKGCELVHNGECSSSQISDLDTFNIDNFLKEKLPAQDGEEENRHEYSLDQRETYDYVDGILNNSSAARDFKKILGELINSNNLLHALSIYPNTSCDEPEYCSWLKIYLILKDGTIVYFDFDYTT